MTSQPAAMRASVRSCPSSPTVVAAATRKRLELWDIEMAQLEHLEHTGKPGKARSGKRPDRSAGHATGKAARGRAEPARFTPSSDPSSDESPDEAQGAPSDPSPDVP